MRPVTAPASRAHPNYTVDPATDHALQTTLDELTWNAQEQALTDAETQRLNALGVQPRAVGLKNLGDIGADRLDTIRTEWGHFDNSERLFLMTKALPACYSKVREQGKNQVGKYVDARGDLLTTLGYYCSYCEIPVGIGVHIEHKLPKRDFPSQAVNWDNMLLACDNCNSNKGDKPTRLYGLQNAIPPFGAIPQPMLNAPLTANADQAMRDGAATYYPWPDDTNYAGYGVFGYRMMRVTYDQWGTRTNATIIDPGDLEVMVLNGQVKRVPPYTGKTVVGSFNGTNLEVELHLLASQSFGQAWFDKATHLITDFDLNRSKNNDLRFSWNSDLRVPLRTDAWFKAISAVPRLVNAYLRDLRLGDQTLAGFTEMKNAVMETAVSTGFWSVWTYVFRQFVQNDGLRNAMLAPFYDPQYFPGTRLPQ